MVTLTSPDAPQRPSIPSPPSENIKKTSSRDTGSTTHKIKVRFIVKQQTSHVHQNRPSPNEKSPTNKKNHKRKETAAAWRRSAALGSHTDRLVMVQLTYIIHYRNWNALSSTAWRGRRLFLVCNME